MSIYANNRRKATQSVEKSSFQAASPITGSDQRKAYLLNSELGPHMLEKLNLMKTTDGRTEADVYTVYKCRVVENTGKFAVETDSAPQLIVEDIVGLDEHGKTDASKFVFYLPTFTIHDPKWNVELLPDFSDWLFSRTRYPELVDHNIYPSDYNGFSQYKKYNIASQIDRFEVMVNCFHCTLQEYFKTKNIKYARNAWQVQSTLNYMLSTFGRNVEPMDEKELSHFSEMIESRDASESDAVKYKKFVSGIHPAKYYHAIYTLMKTKPQLTHKSRFPQLSLLLWGTLTLYCLPIHHRLSMRDLQDHFLRLCIDRGMQNMTMPGNHKCTTREQLVSFCHQRMGTKLQYVLRSTAYVTEMLRTLVDNFGISLDSFIQVTENVSRTVSLIDKSNGISPYCLLISPQTSLDDEIIAELWLQFTNTDAPFKTLTVEAFENKNHDTPCLDDLMLKMQQSMEQMAKELAEIKQMKQETDVSDTASTSTKSSSWSTEKLSKLWKDLKLEPGTHIYNVDTMKKFFQVLYSFCLEGDEKNIPVVDFLVNKCYFMSVRKLITFVLRASPNGSAIFRHYDHQPNTFERYNVYDDSKYWLNQLLWQQKFVSGGGKVSGVRDSDKKVSDKATEEKNHLVNFVSFQLSRELLSDVKNNLIEANILQECGICFNYSRLVPLHNDPRHGVCKMCAGKLETCPYCRQNI